MRKTLLILLLLFLPALADDKAEVLKADQQYVAARVQGDTKALEGLLAADFLVVTHKGEILNKAEFLKYHVRRDLSAMDALKDTVKIRIAGDTAVVTGHWSAAGVDKKEGKVAVKDSAATRVWVREKGHWKLYSLHWTIL